MQTLSANFLSFVLLLILAVSPVQNTIASVSHTNTMASADSNSMQQGMSVSSNTEMQAEHCKGHQSNQCKCDISHCTNVSFTILPITNKFNVSYRSIHFTLSSDSAFVQPLASSLFRPPRV